MEYHSIIKYIIENNFNSVDHKRHSLEVTLFSIEGNPTDSLPTRNHNQRSTHQLSTQLVLSTLHRVDSTRLSQQERTLLQRILHTRHQRILPTHNRILEGMYILFELVSQSLTLSDYCAQWLLLPLIKVSFPPTVFSACLVVV